MTFASCRDSYDIASVHAQPTPYVDAAITFPQLWLLCGDRSSWLDSYQQLHADIVSGRQPPRYLVSVAVEEGVADRLAGAVTLFYAALLSRRAFTQVTYGLLPGFEAACEMPSINWTHPHDLPQQVLEPVKTTYRGQRHYNPTDRTYGPEVDNSTYYPLYLVNCNDRHPRRGQRAVEPFNAHLAHLSTGNVSRIPEDQPDVPYVIAASNRGRSFNLAHNPYHKGFFWENGLSPDNAFMCGFFSLCSPNQAVKDYYSRFWQRLSDTGTLKIGINVRVGDHVFQGEDDNNMAAVLRSAAGYFDCAQKIEDVFALPGQPVIWYLMSDSRVLREGAVQRFGSKLLTAINLQMVHPDCQTHNPDACDHTKMAQSMQHSIGQLLTFSLTDYQVVARDSGFGRLGAWLSGRWSSLYELGGRRATCNPHAPVSRAESSRQWAGV